MATPERIESQGSSLFLWGRRGAAALIALIFLPIVILAITFSGLRSSINEPDDLIQALREADFYSYIHDYLVPSALEDIFRETDHDVIRVAEPWKDDVADSLRIGFPPQEIREETEKVLRDAWPYLKGEKDEFEVAIPIAPRAARTFDELSVRVSYENPDIYDPLTDLVADRVEQEAAASTVASDSVRGIAGSHVTEIAPSDWLFPRLGQAVDDVGAYYIGETENSEITIPIEDRAWAIQNAVIDILNEADIDDAALMGAVVEGVRASTSADSIDVPGFGPLTPELVTEFILNEIPQDEIARARAQVIQDISEYAVGQSDVLLKSDVQVSLAEARNNAPNVLAARVDRRLADEFKNIPPCLPGESPGVPATQSLQDLLPPCLLTGITYETFQTRFSIDVTRMVSDEVRRMIPLSIAITAVDVRQVLGSDRLDVIERLREVSTEGLTIDVKDLVTELSTEFLGDPDSLREYIRSGLVFSDKYLEEAIGDDNESALQAARDYQSLSGIVHILLWAVALVLLFLLAFVGGRGWEGRLTWASVVLGIGAVLAWLMATLPLDLVVRPALEAWADSLLEEYTTDAAAELVLRVEILITALIDGVADRVKSQAIRVGVVAGVALVIARLLAPDSVGRRPAGR